MLTTKFQKIALAVLLCSSLSLNGQVIINELDSDTPGTDMLEFVELLAAPNFSLAGYIMVFYNGSNDQSYLTLDLGAFTTDANGYFLVGNAALVPAAGLVIPNNTIQNGADAVAIYQDSIFNFPNGTAVTLANLVDAVVYSTADPADAGLLAMTPGQPQVDEAGNGPSDSNSIQR
ncbi:MAG TPA: endonuclease I, partial [Planctomycetota bacterium]|nr:endonuclease I [Planctomycetota bacterium]